MKTLFAILVMLGAALADNQYKLLISNNTIATDGKFTWSCQKNGVTVQTANDILPTGESIADKSRIILRNCVDTNETSFTEFKESSSPPTVHGSAMHDATVSATGHTHAETDITSLTTDLNAKTQRVVSGTATFTTTALAAGACQTTVTVAAIGALATDKLAWAFASAPTLSTDGKLTIVPWVTSGNVNFARCNNTAASVTPTALVANWQVTR